MALIKCKECGREMSDTAEKCPHCGYRTAEGNRANDWKWLALWAGIAAVLFLVGVFLCGSNSERFMELSDNLNRYEYFATEDKAAVRDYTLGWVMIGIALVDTCFCAMQTSKISGSKNKET